MKIPLKYYFIFWLKNSSLALATGLLIIYLVPPLFYIFLLVPSFGLIGLVVYQVFVYKYFFGDRRGDFEFAYREAVIEGIIRKAIIRKYGTFVFLQYLMDQTSQIRIFSEDYIVKLLEEKSENINDDLEFAIYMKLAEFSLKNDNYEKQRAYLEKALEKNPMNLVAHFRIAVSLEGAGMEADAIKHYKAALQDPQGVSEQLKEFLQRQISLVETNGPRKKPPIPGLRFITW
ncbi:MAG: tetratricopeptide repeat protein [Desulfobaccales bacterium]